VCTGIVVFSLTVGVLFLEETHEDFKHERDRGRECGQAILARVWKQKTDALLTAQDGSLDETQSILRPDSPRIYRSNASSPTLCSSRNSLAEPPHYSIDGTLDEKISAPPPRVRDGFTRQVCLNIVQYGILAL
jgi:hypothetical protein